MYALRDRGHKVSVLTEYYENNAASPSQEMRDGIAIKRTFCWEREYFADLRKQRSIWESRSSSLLKCWLAFIWYIMKFMFGITVRIFPNNKASLLVDKLEQRYQEEKFDVVFATSAPFHAVLGSSEFCRNHPEIKFCCFIWDPYIQNLMSSMRRGALKARRKNMGRAFERAAVIFETPEVFSADKDFIDSPQKVIQLPVPLLQKITPSSTGKPLLNKGKGKVKIFFAGALHGLRDPQFIMQLLLDDRLKDFELHIAGTGDMSSVRKYSGLLKNRLVFHGYVESRFCYEAMFDTDILLHLGNNTPTQIPGKLFEYMATGKPILHLYFIDNDGCLPYLKKYPNQLSIKAGSDKNTAIDNILKFWQESAGKQYSFSQIEAHCSEFSAKTILDRIADTIEKLQYRVNK